MSLLSEITSVTFLFNYTNIFWSWVIHKTTDGPSWRLWTINHQLDGEWHRREIHCWHQIHCSTTYSSLIFFIFLNHSQFRNQNREKDTIWKRKRRKSYLDFGIMRERKLNGEITDTYGTIYGMFRGGST